MLLIQVLDLPFWIATEACWLVELALATRKYEGTDEEPVSDMEEELAVATHNTSHRSRGLKVNTRHTHGSLDGDRVEGDVATWGDGPLVFLLFARHVE
jgi:hypothetical protein